MGDDAVRRRKRQRNRRDTTAKVDGLAIDVLKRPNCGGRMKLVAMVTDPTSVRAYLRGNGEPCDVPERSPSRGPPYWNCTVLRRKALGGGDDAWA